MKNYQLTAFLCLALAGCSASNSATPALPSSPQTQVAQIIQAVADADQAAVRTVIALRDQGKVSQADTNTLETWMAFVANTDKSIGLILAKNETWAQQKIEIYVLLGTVTAPGIASTLDPGAQALITQILTLLAQLKVQVTP